MYIPCKPQFYYIKVDLRGLKICRHVFIGTAILKSLNVYISVTYHPIFYIQMHDLQRFLIADLFFAKLAFPYKNVFYQIEIGSLYLRTEADL